jgi:hypothetical protein
MAAAAASDTRAKPPAANHITGGLEGVTAPGDVSVVMEDSLEWLVDAGQCVPADAPLDV